MALTLPSDSEKRRKLILQLSRTPVGKTIRYSADGKVYQYIAKPAKKVK